MIDMGMGQHHVGDLAPIDGKLSVFLVAFFSPALEHTTIEQNPIHSCIQKMHGTGYFTSCAIGCDIHKHLNCYMDS